MILWGTAQCRVALRVSTGSMPRRMGEYLARVLSVLRLYVEVSWTEHHGPGHWTFSSVFNHFNQGERVRETLSVLAFMWPYIIRT